MPNLEELEAKRKALDSQIRALKARKMQEEKELKQRVAVALGERILKAFPSWKAIDFNGFEEALNECVDTLGRAQIQEQDVSEIKKQLEAWQKSTTKKRRTPKAKTETIVEPEKQEMNFEG